MIVILFVLVVPIVIKVVREKSIVMKGFAYVTKKEIADIMSWASAFNVRYSAKSLKLLAETRKDKVYEIMQMQNEKQQSKEYKTQVGEVERTNKLRTLIRNLFKFEDETTPNIAAKEDEPQGFEGNLPEIKSSQKDQIDKSISDSLTMPKPIPEEVEDEQSKGKNGDSLVPPLLPNQNNDSALQLDPNEGGASAKQLDEEKILHKRRKESLSQIDISLRRRALLKVSIIFILFMIYSIVNVVYIVMVHSYALLASNQYNSIRMRRPLMSEIVLMSIQAFFENDTHYLLSQTNTNINYLPEYKNRLLGIEESILNFERTGPQFIFSDYISKLKKYNGEQFCSELKASTGIEDGCVSYDSGFFKNGLRASQFRFITFWQSLSQKFLKEANRQDPLTLATYRYNPDITNTGSSFPLY